jgi:hypothetical protein
MVRHGIHLYSIKVDRTGILYAAWAVGCTGRDSHLNEASLPVYTVEVFHLWGRVWRVPQGCNCFDCGMLRFAVCMYSVVLLGDIS